MANINGAFGLRPIAKMGQSTNSTGASEYRIASNNTNPIYQGSPVIPLAAGVIDVVGAAAGGTVGLLGVFWGCEYVSSTTGKKVFSNFCARLRTFAKPSTRWSTTAPVFSARCKRSLHLLREGVHARSTAERIKSSAT
jgi:hypothetical protein